jgi:O-antigen ligase
MLICGSRPLGKWFEWSVYSGAAEEGSSLDRLALIILITLALFVLFKRKIEWSLILKDNVGLIILYLFLGLSILWADYPGVSFRRWIRLLGAIPVAMVILTERSPLEALESILRRCAYILVPFSLVLSKYYPHVARKYGTWSGALMWTGVTLTKNALGQLLLIMIFFIIYAFFREWQKGNLSKTRSVTLADGLIIIIAFLLFTGPQGAYSATSTASFFAGIVSLLLLFKNKNAGGNMAAYLFWATVFMWPIMIFSESLLPVISSALGRDETLTGRIDVWHFGLEIGARRPLLGTGFGSFWGFENNEIRRHFAVGFTGHNGLLDVYIETGIAGVVVLIGFLWSFYRRFRRELYRNFDWGVFGTTFLIISLLCNFTESLFLKSSSLIWNLTVFLVIVFSAPYLDTKANSFSSCS